MFFIGIFGIDQKNKQIGTYNNVICPACGALTRFEIFKSYSYFHIFFIPTFRWNTKYYVRPTCCDSMYELDSQVGEEIERGNNPEIKEEHLHSAYSGYQNHLYKQCRNCGARSDTSYSYCPYCGGKL
ncbi:MAG TPA: zinc ribbon domain-containing protein [Clostridiaceae bacterium]|nr:zinc ribbon domain-containing protein [Clostridiaceae bacterium]